MAEGNQKQQKKMEILKEGHADNTYISDAQLLKIISATEKIGLITAPQYLKENIMSESRTIAAKISHKGSKMSVDLQLFLYGLKITAAMAGTIVLIMVMNPNIAFSQRQIPKPRIPERSVTEVLYQHSNAVSNALNDFSYKLLNWR